LGCLDRSRKIYEKQVETFQEDADAWIQYAEFEASLEEFERAEMIFETAVQRNNLSMPENVWKAYIDF